MKKLKIGLVGCGKIATCNHAPGIAQLGLRQAEIVVLANRQGRAVRPRNRKPTA